MALLQVVFENPAALLDFMTWLDNSGEQYYFQECSDQGASRFDYDYEHQVIRASGTQTLPAPRIVEDEDYNDDDDYEQLG